MPDAQCGAKARSAWLLPTPASLLRPVFPTCKVEVKPSLGTFISSTPLPPDTDTLSLQKLSILAMWQFPSVLRIALLGPVSPVSRALLPFTFLHVLLQPPSLALTPPPPSSFPKSCLWPLCLSLGSPTLLLIIKKKSFQIRQKCTHPPRTPVRHKGLVLLGCSGWPPSCPLPLTRGLIRMTGRANWRFSHALGWGGGWEGVSWMKEGEDI